MTKKENTEPIVELDRSEGGREAAVVAPEEHREITVSLLS